MPRSPSCRSASELPKRAMPSNAKMKMVRTTMNANSPSDMTVRYTVYRNRCSPFQLRTSFKTLRMRNERSAESEDSEVLNYCGAPA